MTNWKKYKLGDLINVKHGFAFKGDFFSDEPTQDILLTPGNFKIGGGFKADKFKYYKGEYPSNYILKKGDILITMTDLSKAGDTLGYSAKIPEHSGIRYLHNQRLGLVQFKNDKIDPDFLYWLLRSKPYQFYIVGSATGSTVKHTSPTRICSYEFLAPEDKAEQRQIAQILTSLDDKIELNIQMNQTLEAMAQAIFKEWFVNFNFPGFDGELADGLPRGWRMGKLGEEFKIIMGQSPKGETLNQNNEGMIFYQGRTDFGFRFPSNRIYTTEPNRIANRLDTLVCVRAPVGDLNMAIEKCCIGRGLSAVMHKTNAYSYTYYSMKNIEPIFKGFESEGTVFGSLNKNNFENIDVVVPNKQIIKEFEKIVNPIDEKILNNSFQIQTLTQTRDTLLPGLMGGKIRLDNLN